MNNRRILRGTAATTVALLAIAGMAACSGTNSSTSDNKPAADQSTQAKIALVLRDFTNPYWAALRDGAVAEAKAQGVELTAKAGSAETDSQGENSIIRTLSQQDYNCFAIAPVNKTSAITPLIPVSKKKIPIVNVDSPIDPDAAKSAGVTLSTFIGSDNVALGKQAGAAMLKALGNTGDVAILQGIATDQNSINRQKGFEDATQGKLKVVATQPADYDENKAVTVATTMLQAHPSITGIFAANDTMGLGVAQAVKNAGMEGKITVISIDGIKSMLDSIKAGTNTATISQYPFAEGQMAVQACMALVAQKPVDSRTVSPIAEINSSNVSDAIAAFPAPFAPFTDPFGTPKSSK